jgi:hypothetical protein
MVNSRALAGKIADTLERDYVFADIALAYAERLRLNASQGAYDQLSGPALAERLTQDLNSVHRDGHLRVSFGGSARPPIEARLEPAPRTVQSVAGGPSYTQTGNPPMRLRPREVPRGENEPPAIEQAEWIAPGIAYIRLNAFPEDPEVTEQVAKFMQSHASANAIIFDLRTNRGGGIAQMNALFPYLFSTRTRLASMEVRSGVAPERPAPVGLLSVAGKPGYTTYEHWVDPGPLTALRRANVFVLTSPRTGSAGEHFTAAMKWSGRGMIVGSATAGANHIGSERELGDGFTLFVPEGRTYNPLTGQDWEGVGIVPDVAVQPEDALRVALIRAGLLESAAQGLANAHQPSLPMQRPKR